MISFLLRNGKSHWTSYPHGEINRTISLMGWFLLSFGAPRVLKKGLILKSTGIPLHPAGCIIIGNILVESMPRDKLLALRVQCLKSYRIFDSKLQCFFGVTEASLPYMSRFTSPIGIHPSLIRVQTPKEQNPSEFVRVQYYLFSATVA